ncbi:MAG: cytochrome P450, partial [Actinomycetota bacterium]
RPRHTTMRLMASRAFTPRVVRRYRDHYHRLAGRLLDRALATADGGPLDVVEHLSVEFPMQAIVELMGTPLDDHDRLLRWSNATISNLDPDYSPTAEARAEAMGEMLVYAQELAAERRRRPTDDLATLLTRQVDEGELTEMEYGGYVILLFVAGNETTRNNISWGLQALAEHPEQWELLKSDPDRHLDGAVEEITRWASPVNYMSRTVHHEVELHGQTLQPGEKVAMMYLSANRDAEVFDEPFRFDITRDPNPQIAFGYGAHFCMGAHLARLETRALLSELVERVDALSMAGPVEYVWSSFINGIKRLPIRMRPV